MTDTCALHLSYIVTSHYTPDKLLPRVPGAKAGVAAQQLASYENESNCRGIIYSMNNAISKAGLKVLELAELERFDNSEEATEDDPEEAPTPTKAGKRARRDSGAEFNPSTVVTRKRRGARTSGGPDDTTELALQRARTRIQINALEADGPHSNELWRMSLKMLCIGREFQPQQPPAELPPSPPPPLAPKQVIKTLEVPGYVRGKKPAQNLVLAQPLPLFADRDINQYREPIAPYTGPPPPGLSSVPMYQKSWLSYAPPPAIHVITPTPVPSATSASGGSDVSDPPSDSSGPPATLNYTDDYRSDLPCGFTEEIWYRILGEAVDPTGIMSVNQQEIMLEWAMDRHTLERERDNLGHTQSAQIWRVLEGTGCLVYEMKT